MAITEQAQAIAIIGQGQLIYLVSQNKRICFWHQWLAHANNAYIVRAAKLINGINLEQKNKEYNLIEIYIDSNKTYCYCKQALH